MADVATPDTATPDPSVLTDSQVSFRIYFAFDATIDDEIVCEPELAFDLHIAGENVFAPHRNRGRAF